LEAFIVTVIVTITLCMFDAVLCEVVTSRWASHSACYKELTTYEGNTKTTEDDEDRDRRRRQRRRRTKRQKTKKKKTKDEEEQTKNNVKTEVRCEKMA